MTERVKFANATLNKLVWKSNPTFRSYKPYHGEKAREEHARRLFKRATKKGVNTEYGMAIYVGCRDRWNRDNQFRMRMQESNLT